MIGDRVLDVQPLGHQIARRRGELKEIKGGGGGGRELEGRRGEEEREQGREGEEREEGGEEVGGGRKSRTFNQGLRKNF